MKMRLFQGMRTGLKRRGNQSPNLGLIAHACFGPPNRLQTAEMRRFSHFMPPVCVLSGLCFILDRIPLTM